MADTHGNPNQLLSIEPAKLEDVANIRSMINDAYSKYIERLGKPPAPMHTDHDNLVRKGGVFVLRSAESILGSISLSKFGYSFKINDLVVDVSAQERGYDTMLMDFAEDVAGQQGLTAVTLCTNERMYESIAFYKRRGFREIGRRTECGYRRVYFRKELVSAQKRSSGELLRSSPRKGRNFTI